ncbi:MAG: SH3 domain-containing protein [Vicinamibacterales bacterium]
MGRHAAAVAVVLVMGTSPLYAQDALFVVTTPSADVHRGPSTGSAVIGKAPRGKTFEVTRELGSWVSVSWPDAESGVGYLHMAWGTISRGAAVQAGRATGAESSVAGSASESDASATPAQVPQAPGTSTLSRPVSLPSHVIGLGGRIGTRAIGFAATGRAWTHGPLGVQIEVGQSTYTNAVAPEQVRSVQVAPSLMYSPPNLVTNAIWARPYIGAGINIYRSTLRSTLGVSDAVDNGLGSQIFGGAEFTWANLPQFALSADLRQQWAPTTFNGFNLGGFGFSMSAHWYVR